MEKLSENGGEVNEKERGEREDRTQEKETRRKMGKMTRRKKGRERLDTKEGGGRERGD